MINNLKIKFKKKFPAKSFNLRWVRKQIRTKTLYTHKQFLLQNFSQKGTTSIKTTFLSRKSGKVLKLYYSKCIVIKQPIKYVCYLSFSYVISHYPFCCRQNLRRLKEVTAISKKENCSNASD